MTSPSRSEKKETITFLHSADWQLGKPFASIADPVKRARVQQERFEAIRRLAAVVRDRQARFVVIAGDLFDSPTPTHSTVSAGLGIIAELGVPVFAIPGNHDHAGPDSLWEQPFFLRERALVAPEFHMLASRTPTLVGLRDRGESAASVVLLPCPLLRRHDADDPTAWIRELDFSDFGEVPRIVIAHGSTVSFAAGGDGRDDDDAGPAGGSNTIAIDRLPLDDIDFIAMGDWHGFMAAGPKAWYAGTPEVDRFPKRGQEPGHVACVTVSRGVQPTVAAVRTGRFRWLEHELALDATLARIGDAETAAIPADVESLGPRLVDDWLTAATRPQTPGEPGFDGCLATITLTGTVTLAGRAELDRVMESWRARLLRFDLIDKVRLAPSPDEIHDLTSRPGDPIISSVAAELVRRLESGQSDVSLDVIRQAIHILHALAHPADITPLRRVPVLEPRDTPSGVSASGA
jgi:DNA repair exonuclease SbcCD nuclease subunit